MITTNILERQEIELTPQQQKLLVSGWGEETLSSATVESIVYLSSGIKVRGYLAYPANRLPGVKFPCVLWNRGGYKKSGFIDRFTARGIFGLMASWGYVVLATMYRGSVEGEADDALGWGAVDDVISIMDVANELPFADTTQWGIEGWSRGGFTSLNVLRKKPVFKAAIFSGAICDLYKDFSSRDFFAGELKKEYPDDNTIINGLSPMHCISELPKETNYLFLHGSKDKTVPPAHSIELASAMLTEGFNLRLCVLEGGDHFLRTHRKETESLRKLWFEKYLR